MEEEIKAIQYIFPGTKFISDSEMIKVTVPFTLNELTVDLLLIFSINGSINQIKILNQSIKNRFPSFIDSKLLKIINDNPECTITELVYIIYDFLEDNLIDVKKDLKFKINLFENEQKINHEISTNINIDLVSQKLEDYSNDSKLTYEEFSHWWDLQKLKNSKPIKKQEKMTGKEYFLKILSESLNDDLNKD